MIKVSKLPERRKNEEEIIMAKTAKASQSEIDGVQYRRAKLWQIILYACNGLVGMSVYSLINMASYSASIRSEERRVGKECGS